MSGANLRNHTFEELSVQEISSPSEVVAVGDEIDVMVLRWDDDGTILVSKRRVDQELALDALEEAARKELRFLGK